MDLNLPREFTKGDITRTAATPADYWNLVGSGWTVVEQTPQQKAAHTRRRNAGTEGKTSEQKAEETSNVPVSTPVPAGDAN